MGNFLSKEIAHAELPGNISDDREIIKKYTRQFYWQKNSLVMWFTAGKINGVRAS